MIRLRVNGTDHDLSEVDPGTPLLWVLRDRLGLTGTKFGCGAGLCGSCTIHLDGEAARACITPVGAAAGSEVTTIEGLSSDGTHPVQKAWEELGVAQCGYCQTGQIMNAAALIASNPSPSDEEIDEEMQGNVCRCGTYPRIRRAIHQAAKEARR